MLIVVPRMDRGQRILKSLDVCVCDGCLSIRDGNKVDNYRIREIRPHSFRTFDLTKADDETYTVDFCPENGTTCSCQGFRSNGYCKHADAVENLCETGSVEGIRLTSLVA